MARKRRKASSEAGQGWLTTYADMVTLMLCFFVALFNPEDVDITFLQSLVAALNGDPNTGGTSLTLGSLADLGNTVNTLPSTQKGKQLGPVLKKATTIFAPDIKTNKIAVTSDERGLVISLLSDTFFKEGSAQIDIEQSRKTLLNVAQFLSEPELQGRRFRVEGHVDAVEKNPTLDAWHLSADRAINVLHYLTDFGADEDRFSIAAYADTQSKFSNETAEGRAYNRRVDIIIVDEGHF